MLKRALKEYRIDIPVAAGLGKEEGHRFLYPVGKNSWRDTWV
jgi:hypothetical protein